MKESANETVLAFNKVIEVETLCKEFREKMMLLVANPLIGSKKS